MPRGSAQRSGWSRLAGALLLGAGLTAVGCVSDRVPRTEAESGAARADIVPASAARPIAGGPFEASGAARVPGTGGVLVVDDGSADAVMWMEVDAEGKQVGSAARVALGASVADPEGIAGDGTRFYVVGSQSKGENEGGAGLVRFAFDPKTRQTSGVEAVEGLGDFLRANVPELEKVSREDGLNIEGLAWDPSRSRLLLGVRTPVVGGDALVVPVALRDAAGPFSASNLAVGEGGAIRLPLGGQGIRSIDYDETARSFLVVSGATDSEKRTEFGLWTWDGGAGVRKVATLDRELKPEGVARVTAGGRAFTLVVCDTGSFLTME